MLAINHIYTHKYAFKIPDPSYRIPCINILRQWLSLELRINIAAINSSTRCCHQVARCAFKRKESRNRLSNYQSIFLRYVLSASEKARMSTCNVFEDIHTLKSMFSKNLYLWSSSTKDMPGLPCRIYTFHLITPTLTTDSIHFVQLNS